MTEEKTLADLEAAWKERMEKRQAEEAEREKVAAEKLRHDYLRRTGRVELKP